MKRWPDLALCILILSLIPTAAVPDEPVRFLDPHAAGASRSTRSGCTDADADGICDDVDTCPGSYSSPTLDGWAVLTGTPFDFGSVTQWEVAGDPDDPVVVFISDREVDGLREIFSRRVSGGATVKLNPVGNSSVNEFRISLDGTSVLYEAGDSLYLVPIHGGNATQVTSPEVTNIGDFDLNASKNRVILDSGQDLGFVPGPPWDLFLYISEWNGDTGPGTWELTPDPRTLVWEEFIQQGDSYVLRASSVDGGGITRTLFTSPLGSGSFPWTVSPDGVRVVFWNESLFGLATLEIAAGPWNALFDPVDPAISLTALQFTPDGSRAVSRTSSQLLSVVSSGGMPIVLAGALPAAPEFVVNNDDVLYIAALDDPDNADLYVVPVTGGSSTKLSPTITTATGDVEEFDFTPDGTRVALNGDFEPGGRRDLYTVLVTGGTATRIVPLDTDSSVLELVADDARVLFETDDETATLQVAPIAGGASHAISTADEGSITGQAFFAEGSTVLYRSRFGGTDFEVVGFTFDVDPDADGVDSLCDSCPTDFDPAELDSDADDVGDVCDNCATKPNRDQADADGDTGGDACDCFPADPVKIAYGPVGGVVAERPVPGLLRLSWAAEPAAESYAVTRGSLVALTANQYGSCVGEVPTETYDDADLPPTAAGFAYLVQQVVEPCGAGNLGNDGQGLERVNEDSAACD